MRKHRFAIYKAESDVRFEKPILNLEGEPGSELLYNLAYLPRQYKRLSYSSGTGSKTSALFTLGRTSHIEMLEPVSL